MKTKIKKSVLIVFLAFSVVSVYSQQNKTIAQMLQGKQWEMQGMTDKTSSKRVDSSKIYDYFNGELLSIRDYYLSDTPDTSFDSSKIGNYPNGKYIITKYNNTISSYIITSITEYKLQIKNLNNPIAAEVTYITKE
jgi:hypothetical protein